MTKNSFLISLLMTYLLVAGCQSRKQGNLEFISPNESGTFNGSLAYGEEVIVTGRVLNKEVYPQEKELTLIIPFFSEMESVYQVPIQGDGSFSFRFPVHTNIREVSIRNYIEHLYVHPGDSVYVEIDFKDMFHPKVAGDSEKLNQEILAFTENAYYYIRDYTVRYDPNFENFEAELKKEYALRLER